MASGFSFELARSSDLRRIGYLPDVGTKSLSLALNRGGSFSIQIPLMSWIATKIEEVSTCAMIKIASRVVWSGPTWTVEEGTPDTLNVGFVGWLQTLEKRTTKPLWGSPRMYSSTDAGLIAKDLVTRSNADNSYSDTNFIGEGTVELTQNRTISYPPWTNVLSAITSLSDLEGGFDMMVHPGSRQLNIYEHIGRTRPQVIFEYGGNTNSVRRTSDAGRMANRVIAYSSVGAAQADDEFSQQNTTLLEEAISLSDVRDISILQAYADAELAVRSAPLRFHSFEPRASDSPMIFRDFDVGDTVYLKARRGRLDITKQAIRIFGCTVVFEESGQERVTSIQTSAIGG